MPDTTTLPMAEGGRSGDGKTNWPVVIGIGGAGVLLLVLLMSSQKSGASSGGTTAAGTSINAALGSIQEENLNLMGQLSQSQGQLSGQIGDVDAHLASTGADLSSQLTQVNSGVIANAGKIDASAQQQNRYYQALTGSLSSLSDSQKVAMNQLYSEVSANNKSLADQLFGQFAQIFSGQQAIRGDITGNRDFYQQAAAWARAA